MVGTASDSVLARLEALTARLDEQAAEIANLKTKTAGLEDENARLIAALAAPPVAALARIPATSRRGMLRRVMHASAAAALLLVAKEAATTQASYRGTLQSGGASTLIYGILASPGAGDPADGINNVTNAGTTHGVIGVPASGSDPLIAPPGGSGVLGQASGLTGELGQASGLTGVLGLSGVGHGVHGQSAIDVGVYGQSTASAGVQGVSTNNVGVYGSGPIGVFATGTGTVAVYGASNGTYGVWGNSAGSAGLIGTSTSYIGVQAVSTNHWGLHAKSPNYAEVFEGSVFVTGQVIALGGMVGASVTITTRATAEDVGEGTLENGRAMVTLEQGFADAANGEYRVFLTELADLGGLYVVQKGPRQFEVRSRGSGQAAPSGRFDYRVVAKPSGPPRMRQAPPDLTTVKPVPRPPEPPRAPEPSGASGERRRP